jgi:hypothetical protein
MAGDRRARPVLRDGRSRRLPASIDASNWPISSAESTEVFPFLTLCLGPRTACAGLLGIPAGDEPVEQHADGSQVLLDAGLRHYRAELLYICSHVDRLDVLEAEFFLPHLENCETATKYARRVLRLRILAVKNSQKRLPADSDRRKMAGSWSAEEAPTRASWRPEADKLSGGESWN